MYLSTQAREIFEELRPTRRDSELVLAGRGSLTRPFAANALIQAMGSDSYVDLLSKEAKTIHVISKTTKEFLRLQM